nr:MAG TPA: hypothetical protein [Caudoviricetes sp.]
MVRGCNVFDTPSVTFLLLLFFFIIIYFRKSI